MEAESWRNSLPWLKFAFERISPPEQFGWDEKFLIEAMKILTNAQSLKMKEEKEMDHLADS